MEKNQRDRIEHRFLGPVDPDSCSTCLELTENGRSAEHESCIRRALLVPAPDMPCYETITDTPEDERENLPARFHIPVYCGLGSPKLWVCAVEWGEGWLTPWPCATALEHGDEIFTPAHHATRLRTDMAALIVAAATGKSAGWRGAADAMAELVANHGDDADREIVLLSLQRGAELREQFADMQINHLKAVT